MCDTNTSSQAIDQVRRPLRLIACLNAVSQVHKFLQGDKVKAMLFTVVSDCDKFRKHRCGG